MTYAVASGYTSHLSPASLHRWRIKMKRFETNGARAALMAICCIGFSGCQTTGDWIAKRFGSSDEKEKIVRKDPTPQPEPMHLTPEKKARIHLTMARAHERQGNVDRAVALYEEAVTAEPKNVDAHHRLAVLFDKQGHVDKSYGHYRTAMKLAPENASIYSDYGYSCYLQGRMDEAEQHLRRALSLDGRLKRAHNNLGMILARKGDTQRALVEFHRAGCNEGEARVNLALAHLSEGRLDAAHHEMGIAAKLPGVTKETREKMARMTSLVSRVDRREAAPVPPTTITASGSAPASGAVPVSRIPTVGDGAGVQFVGGSDFTERK